MQCNNSCNNSCLIWQPEDHRSSWLPNIDVTELLHFMYKYEQEIGAGGWRFDRDHSHSRGDCNCILIILIKGAAILKIVLL